MTTGMKKAGASICSLLHTLFIVCSLFSYTEICVHIQLCFLIYADMSVSAASFRFISRHTVQSMVTKQAVPPTI